MSKPLVRFLLCSAAASSALVIPAQARLVRVEIASDRPAAGKNGGPEYRILKGTFHGELDPDDAGNRDIVDLDKAPRNAQGKVEYAATFSIARPADPAKGSGVLFYDVPNRGYGFALADPDGHVRVVSGWQGDLMPGPAVQSITVPTAKGKNGKALTGPVLVRLQDLPEGASTSLLTGGIGRPVQRPEPVSLDTRKARLTIERADGSRTEVGPDDWAFADCTSLSFPGTPDAKRLCLREGFVGNAAYTLVYQAKDPLVLGIGFAATRDLVSFLRSGKADDAGTPNPAGPVQWTVASGTSQSGNYLKTFLHLGFNADEQGRQVFDGINPNIAARLLPMNIRFAVPGGAARVYEPGSEGTLWWGSYRDTRRGLAQSSLLDACSRSRTCPKVVETIGSAEFWGLRASPGFVGTRADRDLPLPANVRRYYFPGVTHGGAQNSRYGGFLEAGDPVPQGCTLPGNPNSSAENLRAAQNALIAWVQGRAEPPASRYPTRANGDLVLPTARAMGWPAIPGQPSPDGKINVMPVQDFGRTFDALHLSGVMAFQPPKLGPPIPQLVPRVNSDGNETSGVTSVLLQVPLGSYTGWNVTRNGIDADKGCGFIGGFIPFARTRTERERSGDPRPSLEERYGNRESYLARVRQVVKRQQTEGWLLPDDARRIIRQAEESDVLK